MAPAAPVTMMDLSACRLIGLPTDCSDPSVEFARAIRRARMTDLTSRIASVPDFPRPGILFRDSMPLLRARFAPTIAALENQQGSGRLMLVDDVLATGGTMAAATLPLASCTVGRGLELA